MAGLLGIGVSGLTAFQYSLNTTGHNIANADTEGYSRQRVELGTQSPHLGSTGWIGTGVKVTSIERMYDNFLATQVRTTQSVSSQLSSYSNYAERIDDILADPDIGLDSSIQDYFDAMQVLANDPSAIASRQSLLAESQSMVDRFHGLNGQFSDLRTQMNREMAEITGEINSLADSIARVNQNIIEAVGASGGEDPNDLLDQRENLLNELAKRVDISVVEQDDGAYNVFIGKGQALVMGSNAAQLTTRANTMDVQQYDIAFTDQTGTQVITNQLAGGEIGGLLAFRDEILDPGQNQLGLIAAGISDQMNDQHRLGIDLYDKLGGDFFSPPGISVLQDSTNSSAVSVTGSMVDSSNLTSSDYLLKSDGGDLYTLTRLSDGQNFAINTGGTYPYSSSEVDGFSLTISGAATAGDQFLVRPTRDAAAQLSLQVSDPRAIAAAGALRSRNTDNSITNGPNLGTGVVSPPTVTDASTINSGTSISLTFDAANNRFQLNVDLDGDGNNDTLAYDPQNDSAGKPFTLNGLGDPSFTISGVPKDGDSFVIEFNAGGVGDNRNALAMSSLQGRNTLLGDTDTAAANTPTATFQDAYSQLVSDVGSKTRHAQVNLDATSGMLERHQMSLSSVNGVNLDEEAANLIRYQQAYQANAQVISVANTLFDSLLGAVRG